MYNQGQPLRASSFDMPLKDIVETEGHPSIENASKHAISPTKKTDPLSIDPFTHLAPYQPPRNGFISTLPIWAMPYAELMRLHKPAGYYAFLFPHLFGILLAASSLCPKPPSINNVLHMVGLQIVANLFLRGGACSYNDALDKEYDRQVKRCQHRPVARGAVTVSSAHIFALGQTVVWISLLYKMPQEAWVPAVLLAFIMLIYPFCKRWTNFPQVVLGFSFALGQEIGIGCMGYDIWQDGNLKVMMGLIALYASNVINTMIYDTVYAHQDLEDDLKAGVMSMAIACSGWTKQWLGLLSVVEVILLLVTGWAMEYSFTFSFLTGGGTALVLVWMLVDWRPEQPDSCWKWFCRTIWFTGGTICLGMAAEYFARVRTSFVELDHSSSGLV